MIKTSLTLALLIFMSLLLVGSGAFDPLPACGGTNEGNTTYTANVGTLLSSIAPKMNPYGFYNSSVGRNPDEVYALGLCRADASLDQCRGCIRDAATQLPAFCPKSNYSRAYLWVEYCMVQYSTQPLNVLTPEQSPSANVQSNASELNPYFGEDLVRLLRDLVVQASTGSSIKAIVGSRNTTKTTGGTTVYGGEGIYALLQCTPIVSSEDCQKCLGSLIDQVAFDQASMSLAAVSWVSYSCMLRYDTYIFYNETRLREVGVLPPSPPPPPPSPSHTSGKSRKIIIGTISATIGVCLIAAGAFIFIFLRRPPRSPPRSQELREMDEEMASLECFQYEFAQIRNATNDFSVENRLGHGGFGYVYKGIIHQSGQAIAVKRLSAKSSQGNTEFLNEARSLANLQHRNLVKLLGFSMEGRERLLVYEFVQNASLDKFIFDEGERRNLNWNLRHKIIVGVTRGLIYLHEDSRHRIIHRDLKAGNILLDGDMNPKIADFGLAKVSINDEIEGSTERIVGTHGYMSPEYALRGDFSIKSDVYSFGVLVLEIICGQRNRRPNMDSLSTLVWEKMQVGVPEELIDPFLRADVDSLSVMVRCLHIGLLCVQESVSARPTMTLVLQMLDSDMTLPILSEPEPSSPYGVGVGVVGSTLTTIEEVEESRNEASITELSPR